jgi:hypothetical protein
MSSHVTPGLVAACGLVLAALMACSSSSTSGGGTTDGGGSGSSGSGGGSSSGSGGTSIPADAFVAATVGPGGLATLCPNMTVVPNFAIGTPTTPTKPTTVANGESTSAGKATVTCTVTPQGPGFDILLSASAGSGTFTVQSPSGQGAVQSNGGIGLTMNLSDGITTYQGTACTLSYEYQSMRVPVAPAVAAGRIWGHVSCAAAQLQGQAGKQCDTEADFLFEQCTQ